MFRKTPTIIQIQAELIWEVHFDEATRQWVGICRTLNLNATGDTWGEFVECANEVMQLLFEDLFHDGELAEFLRHNDWESATPLPASGRSFPRFDIPFDWERKGAYEELLTAQG